MELLVIDKKAFNFFKEHAGYCISPGETKEEAKRNSVIKLALAEQHAKTHGWVFKWEYDQEPYEMGDLETIPPKEVLCCILENAKGKGLASLCGIGDPTPTYARIVEAELALEAMGDICDNKQEQNHRQNVVKQTRSGLLLAMPSNLKPLLVKYVKACISMSRFQKIA